VDYGNGVQACEAQKFSDDKEHIQTPTLRGQGLLHPSHVQGRHLLEEETVEK
jgi:hypothetical protein